VDAGGGWVAGGWGRAEGVVSLCSNACNGLARLTAIYWH
jgi:hypothetical protein